MIYDCYIAILHVDIVSYDNLKIHPLNQLAKENYDKDLKTFIYKNQE